MTDFVPLLLALPREDDLLLLWRSCVPQLYSERIFPLHFVGQCACGEGEQRDAAQGCRACHSSPSPVPLAVVLSLRESCPLSLLFSSSALHSNSSQHSCVTPHAHLMLPYLRGWDSTGCHRSYLQLKGCTQQVNAQVWLQSLGKSEAEDMCYIMQPRTSCFEALWEPVL